MEVKMIELGRKVKDIVTGFEGIATARCKYLNGCAQIQVTPKAKKDGSLSDSKWFDEPILQYIGISQIGLGNQDIGGPVVNPPPGNND